MPDPTSRQESAVPGPCKHLERMRGLILADSENVRMTSQVQVVRAADLVTGRTKGRLFLALTDRRLLLVAQSVWRGNAQLLLERPIGRLSISITRQKLGGNLIHIAPTDGSGAPSGQATLVLEWVSGHRAREWASIRFRP